jgi:hypothetical protein
MKSNKIYSFTRKQIMSRAHSFARILKHYTNQSYQKRFSIALKLAWMNNKSLGSCNIDDVIFISKMYLINWSQFISNSFNHDNHQIKINLFTGFISIQAYIIENTNWMSNMVSQDKKDTKTFRLNISIKWKTQISNMMKALF